MRRTNKQGKKPLRVDDETKRMRDEEKTQRNEWTTGY